MQAQVLPMPRILTSTSDCAVYVKGQSKSQINGRLTKTNVWQGSWELGALVTGTTQKEKTVVFHTNTTQRASAAVDTDHNQGTSDHHCELKSADLPNIPNTYVSTYKIAAEMKTIHGYAWTD